MLVFTGSSILKRREGSDSWSVILKLAKKMPMLYPRTVNTWRMNIALMMRFADLALHIISRLLISSLVQSFQSSTMIVKIFRNFLRIIVIDSNYSDQLWEIPYGWFPYLDSTVRLNVTIMIHSRAHFSTFTSFFHILGSRLVISREEFNSREHKINETNASTSSLLLTCRRIWLEYGVTYCSFHQNTISLVVNFTCVRKLLKQSIKSKRSLEWKWNKRYR